MYYNQESCRERTPEQTSPIEVRGRDLFERQRTREAQHRLATGAFAAKRGFSARAPRGGEEPDRGPHGRRRLRGGPRLQDRPLGFSDGVSHWGAHGGGFGTALLRHRYGRARGRETVLRP